MCGGAATDYTWPAACGGQEAMAQDKGLSGLTARTYGRVAGLLIVISMVVGGFGEGYVPGTLVVSNDAAQTVANLQAHDMLQRLSFAAYFVESLCDIALAALFYALLRPLSRGLSLFAAMLGLAAALLYAVCQLFYFPLPHLLLTAASLKSFSQEQIDALVLLSIRLSGYGGGMFLIYYGSAWIVRGWLMMRSGYFPRLLGGLMILGGAGFVARTLTLLLAPAYSSPVMLLVLIPGAVLLALWLLVRGIDPAKWEAIVMLPSPPLGEKGRG